MVKMSSSALRRVLVGAVAGVDDADVRQQVLREQVRRAGRRVPHDHRVDAHRLDVLGGVDERLALAGAGPAGGEVERVGPEPAGGEAEADPRPRGRLVEEVDDDLALEVVALGRRRRRRRRRTARPRPAVG